MVYYYLVEKRGYDVARVQNLDQPIAAAIRSRSREVMSKRRTKKRVEGCTESTSRISREDERWWTWRQAYVRKEMTLWIERVRC
ncbi:hypothetical protein SERLADRAFT_395244 [Serpula lacrymans var. lacrymans S7.9]|uniref:Uncharacterized protein n=1 Tax=Serpula lacrymans var. lacrymans (strain S7.9) TaxID=578457 RepID=F8P438_SERL9|nr:uncharacterized protein SERLADRAFT_395244 [Serpula lacrymans var. lacrymans S7.9]EGO22286.1 hypothetical protein SERLADRAFT_395244 [Serpula lacrymans var. lacrymans S7.9]